jgi:hypothetical protein
MTSLQRPAPQQAALLASALAFAASSPPDLLLVTGNGGRLFTHSALLSLHSPSLRQLLLLQPDPATGLTILLLPDERAAPLARLLALLTTGLTTAGSRSDLTDTLHSAAALGIQLAGCRLGARRGAKARGAAEQDNMDVEVKDENTSVKEDLLRARRMKRGVAVNEDNITEKAIDEKTTVKENHHIITSDAFEEKHSEVQQDLADDESESPGRLSCSSCDREFQGRYKLARHRLTHSGVRAFPCTACRQSFTRTDHLAKHKRTVHRSFPPSLDQTRVDVAGEAS